MITHYLATVNKMTDKKEKILSAALELFANDGFNATSTSKIAQKAGVSEGLIFRHFDNKKGLLNAIMGEAESRLMELFTPMMQEENPKKIIEMYIEMPFSVDESQRSFWKLQFMLKWQEEYYNPDKLKPFLDKIAIAFKELGFKKPELEAKHLEQVIESLSISILREGKEGKEAFKEFLLEKYNV